MWFQKKKNKEKLFGLNQIIPTQKGVREEIYKWNLLYPLDKWWRDKYGISFSSEKHRESNLLDIYFEYLELKVYDEMYSDFSKKKNEKGNWIEEKEIVVSDEELISNFEKMLNV